MSARRLFWAAAAAAAGLAFLRCLAHLPRPWDNLAHAHASWDQGEELLHGVLLPGRAERAAWMPLGPVLEASARHLGADGAVIWSAAEQALGAALLVALGVALGSLAAGALAAAALASGGVIFTWGPFIPAVLLCAALLAYRARRPSRAATVALALGLGACLLLRSTFFLLPPLLAIYELSRPRRSLADAAVLALLPYLALLPWIWLNAKTLGAFVPFEHRHADVNIVGGALGLITTYEPDWRPLVDAPSGAPMSWALREIASRPLSYAAAVATRAAHILWYRPLLWALALLGLWRMRGREEFRQLGLLVAYFAGVHALMPVEERYFLPLWPVLYALAPFAFWRAKEEELEAPRLVLAFALVLTLLAAGFASFKVAGLALRGPIGLDAALRRSPEDCWLLARTGPGGLASALRRCPEDARTHLRLAALLALEGRARALESMRHREPGGAVLGGLVLAVADRRAGREARARERARAAWESWRSWRVLSAEPEAFSLLSKAAPGLFREWAGARLADLGVPERDRRLLFASLPLN